MGGNRITEDLLIYNIFSQFDEFRKEYPLNVFPDRNWGVVLGDTSFYLREEPNTRRVWLTNRDGTRQVELLNIQEKGSSERKLGLGRLYIEDSEIESFSLALGDEKLIVISLELANNKLIKELTIRNALIFKLDLTGSRVETLKLEDSLVFNLDASSPGEIKTEVNTLNVRDSVIISMDLSATTCNRVHLEKTSIFIADLSYQRIEELTWNGAYGDLRTACIDLDLTYSRVRALDLDKRLLYIMRVYGLRDI